MQLIGHSKNVDQLNELLHHKKIPHALIFAGPESSGKSLFAHQFAFCLLTQKPHFDQKIDYNHLVWQQINKGWHPDFLCLSDQSISLTEGRLEFKAEDIHKIVKFFQNHKAIAPWRIVIIDSIANLSVRSANSILKIIEEPVSHALIIIIVHNLEDVLPTIRSRCQIIHFNQLSKNDVQQIIQINNSDPIDTKVYESVFKLKCSLKYKILLIRQFHAEFITRIHHALESICHKQPYFYIDLWDDWNKEKAGTSFAQQYNLAFEIMTNYISNYIFDCKNFNTAINYQNKKIIDYWFEAHRQWSDAQIYHLDKKVTLTIIVNNFALLMSS